MKDGLRASEVLYGFAEWLANRETAVTVSARTSTAELKRLVGVFREANELSEPRTNYISLVEIPRETTR